MSRKDRKCSVCGKIYSYFPQCQEDENKPHWYFCFCSENCKNIYDVTSSFEDKRIDGITAKEELKKLDLSQSKNFGESYKKSIETINSFKTNVKTKKDIVKNSEESDNNKKNVLYDEPTVTGEKMLNSDFRKF